MIILHHASYATRHSSKFLTLVLFYWVYIIVLFVIIKNRSYAMRHSLKFLTLVLFYWVYIIVLFVIFKNVLSWRR